MRAIAGITSLADGCVRRVMIACITVVLGFALPMTAAQSVAVAAVMKYQLSANVDPPQGGTVVGMGVYAAGQKITLTAKPAPGYTFLHWDNDEQTVSRSVVMSDTELLVSAYFGTTANILPPVISDPGPRSGMVGVPFSLKLDIQSESLPTVKVTGLPAGLKFDAKSKLIAGVPTASIVNKTITIAAKNVNKTPVIGTFPLSIEPLPAWAQGSFNGWFFNNESKCLLASMNVTSLGRLTGKLSFQGKVLVFSAVSYSGRDKDGVFWVTMKVGTDKIPLTLAIRKLESVTAPDLSVVDGWLSESVDELSDPVEDQPGGRLYRNVWNDAGMATEAANFKGYYTATLRDEGGQVGSGYLTFTVDGKGGVKTAGKLADGTALSLSGTLIYDEQKRVFTHIYIAPAAYKGGSFYGWAEFVKPNTVDAPVVVRSLNANSFLWESLNPAATEEYGLGFSSELELSGGWYSKLIDLRSYYENGLVVNGISSPLPAMAGSVRITDFNYDSESENPPKISWNELREFEAAGVSPTGLWLRVTPSSGVGTGLAPPPGKAPEKFTDSDTRESWYNYSDEDSENPTTLTFNVTRATGLFKGAFNVYYDPVVAEDLTTGQVTSKHVVKKAAYEGVLTPVGAGNAGRGFFLWDSKGTYDTGQVDSEDNPIMKSYSFKRSFDFVLDGP